MLHECFADEIAIDFPSVTSAVERMRDAFLGVRGDFVRQTEVSLSRREALDGLVLPLDVPIRTTCPHCGGRGESWSERCRVCRGTGDAQARHTVRVSLPPGVADGSRFRFRLTSPDSPSVLVELRVAVRRAAR